MSALTFSIPILPMAHKIFSNKIARLGNNELLVTLLPLQLLYFSNESITTLYFFVSKSNGNAVHFFGNDNR